MEKVYKAKDSGKRTILETGSQKEIVNGKGRYDLIPLRTWSDQYDKMGQMGDDDSEFYFQVSDFLRVLDNSMRVKTIEEKRDLLHEAVNIFLTVIMKSNLNEMTVNLAKLYEAGAVKYAARDWELGRPMEIFLNSTIRHFFQYVNGEDDEDHATAVVWNLTSCIDTIRRLPNMAFYLEQPEEDVN